MDMVLVRFKNRYTTPMGFTTDPLEWDEVSLGQPFVVAGTLEALNRFIAAVDSACALDSFIYI
jgi:hypothetical protein